MSTISRREFVKTTALAPLAVRPFALGPQASKEDRFDVVVAGAGHNSMIAAAYLAKAGYRCLVLEGRPMVGGGVKTASLTLKGFKDDVCSTAHTFLLDNPMMKNNELQLQEHGLEYIDPDPLFHLPFPDGTYLTLWRDVDRTCAEMEKFSKKDAAAFRKMLGEYDKVRAILVGAALVTIEFAKPVNDQLDQQQQDKIWPLRRAMS
jgi:phytoene dehydrogenase-like protein